MSHSDLTALAPLAARVCPWLVDDATGLAGRAREPENDDAPVHAMPLVLRLERPGPDRDPIGRSEAVTRTAVLAAAADAAAVGRA